MSGTRCDWLRASRQAELAPTVDGFWPGDCGRSDLDMPAVANGIRVDAPYRLIQGIRLVHALMESSYRVHVPTQHEDKFTRLREAFGADFTVGADGVPELTPVALSHREPRTAIGSLERPLIFPHAIVR